jgi:hypothetical protein
MLGLLALGLIVAYVFRRTLRRVLVVALIVALLATHPGLTVLALILGVRLRSATGWEVRSVSARRSRQATRA